MHGVEADGAVLGATQGSELADHGIVEHGRDVGETLLLAAGYGAIQGSQILSSLLLTLITHFSASHGFLRGGRTAEHVSTGGLCRADGLLDLARGGVVEPGAEFILGLGVV